MVSLCSLCVLFAWFFAAVYGEKLNIEQKLEFFSETCCPAVKDEPWSYCSVVKNGPPFWGSNKNYTKCYGAQQSPIHIIGADNYNNLPKLSLNNYDKPISSGTIKNNGHTIQVTPGDGVSRTISVNGEEYGLQQLHFHWGDKYNKGSEHAVDFQQYAMEMHLVHMNANNGIAAVGIFFQEDDKDNGELEKIIAQFSDVKYKDDERELKSELNLNGMVPANPTSYYRYHGSLTTPPCSEGVIWSVVKDPIPVGRVQMKKFRNELYSDAKGSCKLVNNFRPLQLRNGRAVSLSQ